MKHTLFVLGICLSASFTWAQSTCETRVDAHPKASTVQRVQYCLTEDSSGSAAHNPGLVFSGVSSPKEQAQSAQQPKATARKGAFKPQRIEVTNQFVETQQFPKLSDGRVSQQEIYAKKQAEQEGKQMAQEAVAQSACTLPENEQETVRQPVLRKMTDAPKFSSTAKPARKTVRARKKATVKAQRTVKIQTQSPAEPVEEVVNELAPEQELAAGTAPYAPVEVAYEEYMPADPAEIPVGTASYAPAN